ncbi:hypothetical protein ACWPKO_17795 [Coraliomargarita sp. W4R53]
MEYELQFIPQHALVIEIISGELTLEDMIDKTQKLFSDPKYDRNYSGVIDLRQAINRISKVELLGFAKLLNGSDLFGHAPWAILGDDPMVIALSQVFQLHQANPENIGIFATVTEAAKFLGKPILLEYLND